jgi:hypothetical protein
MPRHLCRLLGIRIRTFVWEAYKLPVALVTPFVLALLLLRRWFIPHTYLQLGLGVGLALLPYGAGVLWALWSNRIWHVDKSLPASTQNEIAVALIESYQEER